MIAIRRNQKWKRFTNVLGTPARLTVETRQSSEFAVDPNGVNIGRMGEYVWFYLESDGNPDNITAFADVDARDPMTTQFAEVMMEFPDSPPRSPRVNYLIGGIVKWLVGEFPEMRKVWEFVDVPEALEMKGVCVR